MAHNRSMLTPTLPITWDDPRCTPEDTFPTWMLKVAWPRLLHGNVRKKRQPSHGGPVTIADCWDRTVASGMLLTPQESQNTRCKACGTGATDQNPLLWGNIPMANAHGRNLLLNNTNILFAQDYDFRSGDTNMSLIQLHTSAPMIYCLACTLCLDTKVMDVLTGDPCLAFWWTPHQEAWPWTDFGALWTLPRERPLVFRAESGSGKNHQKWAPELAIQWDPNVLQFPVHRDDLRGAYSLSIPVDHIASLPAAFAQWYQEQRAALKTSKAPKASPKQPDSTRFYRWLLQHFNLDPHPGHIGWNTEALYAALKPWWSKTPPPLPVTQSYPGC